MFFLAAADTNTQSDLVSKRMWTRFSARFHFFSQDLKALVTVYRFDSSTTPLARSD